jgi:hypothetical protein
MTAAARGLSEHPLPDLVMAGSAGDPHLTHAPAAPEACRAATQLQHVASLNGAGGRKPRRRLAGFFGVLNCQRSLLAKVSDFPG